MGLILGLVLGLILAVSARLTASSFPAAVILAEIAAPAGPRLALIYSGLALICPRQTLICPRLTLTVRSRGWLIYRLAAISADAISLSCVIRCPGLGWFPGTSQIGFIPAFAPPVLL